MDNKSSTSQTQGFDPQVISQLQQIAMAAPSANHHRGQQRRGRGRPYNASSGQGHDNGPQQSWSAPASALGTDMSAFPPLGAAGHTQQPRYERQARNPQSPQIHPQRQVYQNHPRQTQNQSQYQQMPQNSYSHGRDGHGRARGSAYRQHPNSQFHTQAYGNQPRMASDDFARPPPQSANRLYNHNQGPHYGTHDQQRSFRHKLMMQSDFLASLASQSLKNQVTQEELVAKEAFRRRIQFIAQQVVASLLPQSNACDPGDIRLKLYGSLGSGFAVTGSDMDLLLVFPKHEAFTNIEIESRRLFEKALLDEGIGARLLTNTRVPILKVCERPHPTLLQALRQYRAEWELQESTADSPTPDLGNANLPETNQAQLDALAGAFEQLQANDDAMNTPLPQSPISEQARLEFSGDCGIQCDINFANHVALHNTELLRIYGSSDARVRQMGIFVKNWAKARDINTPYLGTLSSYGYIQMVLHYLMNIANPPVIPNLQHIQVSQDQWKAEEDIVIPRVDGFDVRFVRDPAEIQQIKDSMPRNHDSLGALLRGFFWYYSQPQGFHWGRDVISIRTPGGKLSKQSKGWTEAKWADQTSKAHVRLRYLLAIEDPFETEHNVARTVGHHGIVAIRDEFRRAWSIIDTVEYDTLTKTYSSMDKSGRHDSAELMSSLTDRGDLLRKDQNFHKDKIRRMRQEAEAKEQALKSENLQETASVTSATETGGEVETNGTWMDKQPEITFSPQLSDQNDGSDQRLMRNNFQTRNRGWRSRTSRRQVEDDEGSVVDHEGTGETQIATQEDTSWWNAADTSAHCQNDESEQQPQTYSTGDDNTGNKVDIHSEVISQEMSSRMQSHFELMGDRIFARSSKANMSLEPHNRSPHSQKKLGTFIHWDKQLEAGKWLLWRDRQVYAGKHLVFNDPVLKTLHEDFPCDPNMTYADLTVANEKLRERYAKSLVRVNDTLMFLDPADDITSDTLGSGYDELDEQVMATPAEQMQDFQQDAWVLSSPNSYVDSHQPEVTDASLLAPGVLSPPSLEQLREKRTQYFSQAQQQNINSFEQNRQIYGSNPARANNIPEQPYSFHAEELVQRAVQYEDTKGFTGQGGDEKAVGDQSNHQQKLLSLLNVQNTQPGLTQRPVDQDSDRVRDIHSELASLLRRAGFQFDSQQLADLNIIQQGGNGCARNGQAFAVEEDYELGGGGAMASMPSSGRRCVSESGIKP